MTNDHVWDRRFLEMAQLISSWSKDPSTRVGAVIVDKNHRIVSLGYNGFPYKVHDFPYRLENRELKLQMTVHAEINAILFANKSVENCTLYIWPMQPCAKCASVIIQSGITRVVSPNSSLRPEWQNSFNIANNMFEEANVEMSYED
jgi:dCMP deaminase